MSLLSAIRKTPVSAESRARSRCLKKFLHYFPGGFQGKKYLAWERDYKWNAHLQWKEKLNRQSFKELLEEENYSDIAKLAVTIESKTNLLFSFEKMALRDAVKTKESAKLFAEGLYKFIYGRTSLQNKFDAYRDMLANLPVKQTRVLTWPVLTVFGFIADPASHIYLKPTVTKKAAEKYKFEFRYSSKPSWDTYQSLLDFAALVRKDTSAYKPRDMMDIQSFIWVIGSEEYPD